jgi:hypothetical protein
MIFFHVPVIELSFGHEDRQIEFETLQSFAAKTKSLAIRKTEGKGIVEKTVAILWNAGSLKLYLRLVAKSDGTVSEKSIEMVQKGMAALVLPGSLDLLADFIVEGEHFSR